MGFGISERLVRERHNLSSAHAPSETVGLSRLVSYSILFATTWLLVAPRIPIFNLGGSSIRAEDFILVFLGITVLARWKTLPLGIAQSGIALIVVVNLTAAVVATATDRVDFLPAAFYSLRVAEYWLVLPALCLVFCSLGSEMIPKILGFVTVAQVFTAALQTIAGVNVGFSKFSYERGSGLTAGPYELGAICAMLAVYWVWKRSWLLTATAIAGVLVSASRISIPALLLGIGCMVIFQRLRLGMRREKIWTRGNRVRGPANVVLTILLFAVAVFTYAVQPADDDKLADPTLARFQDTSVVEAWGKSGAMASNYESPATSEDYSFIAYDSVGVSLSQGELGFGSSGDDSNLVRFFRWHILLETINDPLRLAIGLGPSFAGPSVDGSFVRMFAETGLFGLMVWFFAVRKWFKGAMPWLVGALVTVLVGGVFIDILVAMRPMVLMWVFVALSRYEAAQKKFQPAKFG